MRANRRTRLRRAIAVCTFISLAVILVLPVVAMAAGNLVTDYDIPGFWMQGSNDDGYFTASGEYGDIDGWGGTADVIVKAVTPENPYTGLPEEKYFTSFEDFAARSGGSVTLYTSADQVAEQIDYVWAGAKKTTLGGLEAWSNVGVYKGYDDYNWFQTEYQYWIPTDDGGIYVSGGGYIAGDDTEANFDAMINDVESVLTSLRFNASGGSAGPALPGDGEGSSPWRTVTGGIAAVAAAAIAMAGAAASARAKKGEPEPEPDKPVGYVLQLSAARLTVSEAHSATLTIQAFRVLPTGQYQPAPEAGIAVTPSSGVSVEPSSAYGTLTAAVWQTGPVAMGAGIAIQATAPSGATQAMVRVAAAGASRIATRFEPAGKLELRTEGEDSVTLVAAVELLGADAMDPAIDPATVRASVAFAEDSEWLEISAPADYEDGRAITVRASRPDSTSFVQPPESAAVRVTAMVGERPLTAIVTVNLARLPKLEASPDQISLAADSGESAEIRVWVESGSGAQWQFDTEWREGARLIATPDITSTGASTASLTLTESAGDRLDPARPQTASTLVVLARAEGYEPLKREIEVIVTQEGLFIDRTLVDPSTGAFHLEADGSAKPAEIDVRVFVRDPATNTIAPDISLAQQVRLEIAGEAGTSGYAGLKAGGLLMEAVGVRPGNVPSATFRVAIERQLPTGGEALPASLRASVPGHDEGPFSALVPLRLLGVNTDPFSAAWQTELDGCRNVIQFHVPLEYHEHLHALVNERSLTMGAEGLYLMRTQLWSFAYDQLMKKKHEHLDSAWWIQQIEDTLDWVSWCGDIAFGVASGTYLGVVGAVAIGMLKPMLVSAMEVWIAGGSPEDWLAAQTSMLTGTAEGILTDPDVLSKLTADKKAIAWALFIAYYFMKELYNDPKMSVTNAMTNVGKQLRDEGLIMFLKHIANMKSVRGPRIDAGTAKKPGAPDSPDARKQPDAPEKRPDAPEKKPDAPEKKPDAPEKQPDAPEKKPAPKKPKGSPQERAAAIADDIAAKTADGKPLDRATVERIMVDPDAMRELKNTNPEAWKKINETRSEVYKGHDADLKEWIEKNVPEADGRRVEIRSVGTIDGVDRDYRAGYVVEGPDGTQRFIEFKKESWAGESQRIFAKETGGPTDPKGAAKWAKDHQQLATDQYHAEASVDMADQGHIYNERTGKWEKTQLTPNADLVKRGESTLIDPEGYGKTYESKVAEAYHEGNHLDAYAQADKAVHSLECVREGYAMQHYGIKQLPPKIDAGMQAIKDVQAGKITPAQADSRLKELKYTGGLPDFMEKVSGQFAGLKWARKA